MIKKISLLVLLFLASQTLLKGQFYGTEWGDTQDQVTEKVGAGYQKNGPNQVVYKKTIGGKDSFVGFVFLENKLVSGMFLLDESHTNKNYFIDDYNEWKSLVREKFGAPDKDRVTWQDDTFKNSPKDHGTAVSLGHLILYSEFHSSDTEVRAVANGDNYKINVKIQYVSLKYKDLADRLDLSDF